MQMEHLMVNIKYDRSSGESMGYLEEEEKQVENQKRMHGLETYLLPRSLWSLMMSSTSSSEMLPRLMPGRR